MAKTKRELIALVDDEDSKELLHGGQHPDFKYIQERDKYFDTEKGMRDVEIIVQRKEDKKFFKCTRSDWSAGQNEYDFNLEEVFPIQKTITVYE